MRPEFSWRNGNQVSLLVDGDRFFDAMLNRIQGARSSVLLEMYLVASGELFERFIRTLSEAVERGVTVCLLFDHYGSRDLTIEDRNRLRSANIGVAFYNPVSLYKWGRNFARDHRKLMIVDQRVAFIGGAGLTDAYWIAAQNQPETPWHDLMVQIEGAAVQDLVTLFIRQWEYCTSRAPVGLQGTAGGRAPAGAARVRLLTSAGPSHQQIKFSVLGMTRFAQRRVWIGTAYFMPSFALRLALRRAARRGLDVRLLVAGPLTDHRWIYYASKRYYRRLLNAGVRIYEYQPRMLHAKYALFDDRVSVGSCNLDNWNLRWNLEANVEVDEPGFSDEVEQLFRQDFACSHEIRMEEWARRPWYRKLRELVWALICQLILRIR